MLTARAPLAMLLTPALVFFVSSNLVNAGNLLFNVLFSRWLGPELFGDLALLLTVKLSLLVLFTALQSTISRDVAAGDMPLPELAGLNRALFIALWMVLPLVLGMIWAADLGQLIGLSTPGLLSVLVLSLPFVAPLSLLRGIALGRGDMTASVVSANLEMTVRLFGAIVAWWAGLGLAGIVAAIALSIPAGALPLLRQLPAGRAAFSRPVARRLALGAAPFALLQLAQIGILDADVIIAKISLGATAGGLSAALSLFQRIEVFACYGMAAVLLPRIAAAHRARRAIWPELKPVLSLFVLVVVPVVGLAASTPRTLLDLLVGAEYVAAAPLLWLATVAAAAFTLSFIVATTLAALGDRRGIAVLCLSALAQVAMIGAAARLSAGLEDFLIIKTVVQAITALTLATMMGRVLLTSNR